MRGYMLMLYIILGVKAFASLLNLPLVFNPLLQGKSTEKANEEKDRDTGETLKGNVVEGTGHTVGITVESTGHISGTAVGSSTRLSATTEEDTAQLAVITRQSSSVLSC